MRPCVTGPLVIEDYIQHSHSVIELVGANIKSTWDREIKSFQFKFRQTF